MTEAPVKTLKPAQLTPSPAQEAQRQEEQHSQRTPVAKGLATQRHGAVPLALVPAAFGGVGAPLEAILCGATLLQAHIVPTGHQAVAHKVVLKLILVILRDFVGMLALLTAQPQTNTSFALLMTNNSLSRNKPTPSHLKSPSLTQPSTKAKISLFSPPFGAKSSALSEFSGRQKRV